MPIVYVMTPPRGARPAVPASTPAEPSSTSRERLPLSLTDSLCGLLTLASQTENCARIALSATVDMESEPINVAAARGIIIQERPPFTPAESRALDLVRKTRTGTIARTVASAPITVAGICVGAVCVTATSASTAPALTSALGSCAQLTATQAAALLELHHSRATESSNTDIFLRMDSDEAIRRFNDQLKGVNDVSAALHGAADLTTVLPDTLTSVLAILDADGAVLWRYDAPRDALSVVTRAGIAPTDIHALERTVGANPESAIRRAVKYGENVTVDDVASSDLASPVRAAARLFGV